MTKCALTLIVGLFLSLNVLAQKVDTDLPAEVVYEMKRQILKRYAYFSSLTLSGKSGKAGRMLSHNRLKNVDNIVFGYFTDSPKMYIRKSGLGAVPGTNFHLFEVGFNRIPENKDINDWSAGQIKRLFQDKLGLFLVDIDTKVVMPIYPTFKNDIISYFNSVPNRPDSYVFFIKALSYLDEDVEVNIDRLSEDSIFINRIRRTEDGFLSHYRYQFSFDDPGNYKIEKIKILKPKQAKVELAPRSSVYPKLEIPDFSGTEDKKRYLFEALMENLYLYKFHQKVSALPDSVDPETLLDSLIPDYDVYLPRMYHLRYGCCWESEERVADLKARLPEMMSFSYDYEREPYLNGTIDYKFVSAEHRFYYRDIEYYKIYVDSLLLWHKREDPQFADSISWDDFNNDNIYDTYYQPQWKAITERALRYSYPLVVSPEPLPARYLSQCAWANSLGAANNHYDYPYHYIKQPRANHYLLALDTETRDVYFISGKDIFLTKTVPLYLPYVEDKEARRRVPVHRDPDYSYLYKKGDWRMLFTYIQDRLYRYLVERLDRSNVIYEDDEKVVLRCKGEEYKKEIELEVTLYFDDPENLEVKRLN
ncbi:hypothetical protein [Phaeodactylibacter xiamenensis]|uniref:hypothetical protein n=1 Tax=Phaeodactylibacter xiamenensis TaxID=1524460 RepID=UPI0024A81B0F|nr:hypothetical protein [Phaeodactylibacter xiamenensis]